MTALLIAVSIRSPNEFSSMSRRISGTTSQQLQFAVPCGAAIFNFKGGETSRDLLGTPDKSFSRGREKQLAVLRKRTSG